MDESVKLTAEEIKKLKDEYLQAFVEKHAERLGPIREFFASGGWVPKFRKENSKDYEFCQYHIEKMNGLSSPLLLQGEKFSVKDLYMFLGADMSLKNNPASKRYIDFIENYIAEHGSLGGIQKTKMHIVHMTSYAKGYGLGIEDFYKELGYDYQSWQMQQGRLKKILTDRADEDGGLDWDGLPEEIKNSISSRVGVANYNGANQTPQTWLVENFGKDEGLYLKGEHDMPFENVDDWVPLMRKEMDIAFGTTSGTIISAALLREKNLYGKITQGRRDILREGHLSIEEFIHEHFPGYEYVGGFETQIETPTEPRVKRLTFKTTLENWTAPTPMPVKNRDSE
ncbi:MAG: hypothetical protein FWE16_05790 [Firmicutes bacterium]|nr:hypothetical protein [Bacillota bacterium]